MSRDGSQVTAADIAAELRAAIGQGAYKPGDRLPGENPLMERYGVARMTARKALAALQGEGLTTTRRGVGVFVRDFKPVIRNSTPRLNERQWRSGRPVWDHDHNARSLAVDNLTVDELPAPEDVRVALALDDDARVIVRDRRYSLDGRPVMTATSYLPAAIAGGTRIAEKDTGAGGIYARLDELGHGPVHFREDLVSRMPSADEANELRIEPGTPVIVITRTAATDDGTPVEVNRMTLDAASFVIRYDFEAS